MGRLHARLVQRTPFMCGGAKLVANQKQHLTSFMPQQFCMACRHKTFCHTISVIGQNAIFVWICKTKTQSPMVSSIWEQRMFATMPETRNQNYMRLDELNSNGFNVLSPILHRRGSQMQVKVQGCVNVSLSRRRSQKSRHGYVACQWSPF